MKLSPVFTKAVAAVALAAAVVVPAGYTGLRYERNNNRYATCLAQNLGGEAGMFSITNLEGKTAALFPLYRTHGLEHVGVRTGVIANTQNNRDDLALVLTKTADGSFRGHWDFVKIGGQNLPRGTYGRGDPLPDASQMMVGHIAEFCANTRWVRGPGA
ncbi:MAG: hypothetical protein DI551_02710 [Micavibrio aeruginosavorus]|uniref:Uncharacterized protein n=1 Tax=Micavibrio aeruginosavorus TaxID=349221 RepID=A0A2W5N2F2_9BACT|nr:MAG: hypothetical protein DI551_02710 [Micavibrio aeruginosavorus]